MVVGADVVRGGRLEALNVCDKFVVVAGGVFFAPLPSPIREMSFIYWGVDAFTKLSENNADIIVNLIALMVQGIIFFVIGLYLFNRRVEI